MSGDEREAEIWLVMRGEEPPEVPEDATWHPWPGADQPVHYRRRTLWQWITRQPRTTDWQLVRISNP